MPQIDFKYFDILWKRIIKKHSSENKDEFTIYSLNDILGKYDIALNQTDIANIDKKYLQFSEQSDHPETVNLSNNIYEKLLRYADIKDFSELYKEYELSIKNDYEQIGFLGRIDEIKELEDFILSDKKIFGLVGVPMIGKSALVNHFIEHSICLADFDKPLVVRLNPQPENAEQKIYLTVFGNNDVNDFSIFKKNTLIIIQNFEEVLQWNGDAHQLHSLKDNYVGLKEFIDELIKAGNIKIIFESRFQIHFREIISDHHKLVKTLSTQSQQLEGIDKEEFWKFYKFKNFTRENFKIVCNAFNNHTALLAYAYNDVDWLYDNDLLNAVTAPQATTKYLWKYVEKTLNRLEYPERLILCALTLLQEPVSQITLFEEVITPLSGSIQISEYEDYLTSLRKKLLINFFNSNFELNPYIREICYTSFENNFQKEFNNIKNNDFIRKNFSLPKYDKIRQALERGDYKLFFTSIKQERADRNFGYVHKLLNEALLTNAKKIIILSEIGITFKIEKKWKEAIVILEKALNIENNDVKVLNELAICYRQSNQLERAIKTLEKALKIENYNIRVLNELGICYRENKQLDNAIEILERAVKLKHIHSFNELAICYSSTNQLDKAIETCEQAISLNNYQSYTVLSITYEMKGDIEKALEVATEGLETNGWDKSRLLIQFNRLEKLIKHKPKTEKLKIFLSYSSADRNLREIIQQRLDIYLKSAQGKYDTVWTDKEIPVGGDWNGAIHDALTASNVGILLVSPMFLGSKYSMGEELKIMLELRRTEGYTIIPLLLRECNFLNNKELGAMQFFKTYQSEYDVTDLLKKDKLMPFDELADIDKPNERLLNKYFQKFASAIDSAIKERK